MALRIAEQVGRSDVGRQRSANEDSLVLRPPFFAVADGMGGARAGEVASAMAADAFEGAVADPPLRGAGGENAEAQLSRLLREANRRIYDLAVSDESVRGMGTTLTAAKVVGDEISLAHVGDSRAYRLRDDELVQITRDHSLVAELQRSGQITPEAAEHHPQRSIITRALGPEPDVEVDTYTVPGRPGDVFLLCSDGLTSMISDDEVGAILRGAGDLNAAAEALIRAANQSGGKDNITVVLFRLEDGDELPAGSVAGDEATIAGQLTADDVRAGSGGRSGATGPRAGAADRARTGHTRPSGGHLRRAPVSPARRRSARRAGGRSRGRVALKLVLGVALVAAAVTALYALSRQVYFVGTNDGGLVTIYQGVPYELPFGLDLYDETYASGMPARAIPAARRARVLDHEWRSREDAVDLVRSLERGQLEGGAAPPVPSPTGTPADVRPHTRAVRPAAGLPARGGRLRRGARHPHRGRAGRHAHLRRRVPRALRGGPPVHPRAPARRRSLPVPAGRARGGDRPGADLPHRRRAGARAGPVVRGGAGLLLHHDPGGPRPPRARALPLPDRGGQHRAADHAAAAGNRRAGERRLPGHQARPDPVPAGRVREARHHHLPRQLPARDG